MKRSLRSTEKRKSSNKRKRKKWPIALGIVGGVVVVAVIAVIILAKSMTSGLKQVKVSDDEFGIEKTTAETSSNGENKESETEETKIPDDITNIVFLGIDREENRKLIGILTAATTESITIDNKTTLTFDEFKNVKAYIDFD